MRMILIALLFVSMPVLAQVTGVWVPSQAEPVPTPDPEQDGKIYFDFKRDCQWMELYLQNEYKVMAYVCIPKQNRLQLQQ